MAGVAQATDFLMYVQSNRTRSCSRPVAKELVIGVLAKLLKAAHPREKSLSTFIVDKSVQ